jgi:hypothetical protein
MLIFNPFFELTNIRHEWREYYEQIFDILTNTLWKEEISTTIAYKFSFQAFCKSLWKVLMRCNRNLQSQFKSWIL